MTAQPVTDDSFETEVCRSPRPVIVEYWAQWCGPCRQVIPVLDEIGAAYEGRIEVRTLNVDENPATAFRYGVLAVPTVSVFVGGEAVKQLTGARSKAAFLREFGPYLDRPA